MSRAGVFFRTTVMIVALTLISRVLGFVRQIFITNEFGISAETDAYFFAYNIPFTLFLIIPGAVNSVLIPTLKGLMGKQHLLERNVLFHQVHALMASVFVVITAAGMIWSPEIIKLLAPSFSPDKQALTADMLRIMMPSVFFIGLIATLGSFLNAHDEFLAPSLGPVFNGMILIASIYTLAPLMGMQGIAWGTLLGFIVFALYLVPPVLRKQYTFRWNGKWRSNPLMRGMGERFVPIMIGLVISQLYLFIEKIFAGELGDQKISALWLAFSMVQLPIAIFSGALVVPLFPLLSEYVKQNRMPDMKQVLGKGFIYQYHVLLPSTLGLILLSQPFVHSFYGHGSQFTIEEGRLTAWAVVFYSVGMLGWAGRDLFTRASYAIENTRAPVITAAISFGVYLLLARWLMKPMDLGGLALAYSLSTFVNVVVQTWWLRRQIGKLFDRDFFGSIWKGLVATAVMSGVIFAIAGLSGAGTQAHAGLEGTPYAALAWLPVLPDSWVGIAWLIGIVMAAALSYFLVLFALKDQYMAELMSKMGLRFRGSKAKEVE